MLPGGRPMRADARRNRGRLIVAARQAFTEHGPEASLDEIAKRAGVGPGTLYRHFPTRESLLAAVYLDDIEALSAQADRLLDSDLSPSEALSAFLLIQLDYVKVKRGLGAAVKAMLGMDAPTMTYCRDTLRGALGRLMDPARQAGLIRADVEPADVLRLTHGVAMACESAPDDGERLLGYVIDGLRPPPASLT
ncbi:TetR family transcriptional regulator [Rugosimonospora africana]|uniref:TetR family transcriptional regulator n=2 Tax=Rugosimonospora africana TaxID=556532 RepID=A0A8J3QWR2_9ACTN|nr:TetR family transcriptional regulator [Rugosimonospora africana]